MDFMMEAVNEARKAAGDGEIPVGAVIVLNGKIIARAHNMREMLKDPSAHAEMLAIREASKVLDNWRLMGCEMYVTLEPCPMCAGAILQSRLKRIHIGTADPTAGACGSVVNVVQNRYLNSMVDVVWDYNSECSKLLDDFFRSRRRKELS